MSEPTLTRLSRPTRDWLSGTVLALYADSYVQYLAKQGYATSTIDTYLRSIAHFSRWTTRRQISLDNIKESVVSRFLEKHLPVCRCARHCRRSRVDVRAALSHLLAHLRQENIIAAKAAVISNFIAAELDAFGGFLTDVRGLCDVTQQTRLAHIRRFLLDRFPEGPVSIGSLLPKDIDQFIMKKMGGWKPSSLKAISNSLRSYLRFKATRGVQTACLIAALPRIAQWRLAGLPKGLTAVEIQQFLHSFDQRTATGRRDYAISRCFVDLGLRTSEIGRIKLGDVIWREGVLRIHGKRLINPIYY